MRLNQRSFWMIVGLVSCVVCFAKANETLVDEKYSLKADREALEQLRKDIPPEKRNENDEKAFIDDMMSDLTRQPTDVRSKFSRIVSKKRDLFNKDITKQREAFQKEQKQSRDKFNAEIADERKSFAKKKSTSDERKDFFDKVESKRRDFYSEQKEKRDDFEADIRDRRKNFEDYFKSKNDEFNQRHREYVKLFDENRKLLAHQKRKNEIDSKEEKKKLEQEYEGIRKQEPTVLAPESGE